MNKSNSTSGMRTPQATTQSFNFQLIFVHDSQEEHPIGTARLDNLEDFKELAGDFDKVKDLDDFESFVEKHFSKLTFERAFLGTVYKVLSSPKPFVTALSHIPTGEDGEGSHKTWGTFSFSKSSQYKGYSLIEARPSDFGQLYPFDSVSVALINFDFMKDTVWHVVVEDKLESLYRYSTHSSSDARDVFEGLLKKGSPVTISDLDELGFKVQ